MELGTTDQATSSQLRLGQTDEGILSELVPARNSDGSSKDDEDFLSGLTSEEKECLEYFLQTISTLDGDISEEDDEGCHKELAMSVGSEDQGRSSEDSSVQQGTTLEAAPATPVPSLAVSKTETIKSLSEEADDSSQRSRGGNYDPLKHGGSINSHPTNVRKFDTIVRSGVSVHELRSRFLLRSENSASVEREPRGGGAGAFNPLPGIQKSPKEEALQKLGLLQRSPSAPNMKIPPVPMTGQQLQISPGESLDSEGTAGSRNPSGKPL